MSVTTSAVAQDATANHEARPPCECVARAADGERRELVESMIHDLRGPATAILGYAQMLRRRGAHYETARRDRVLSSIEHQARRLTDLVNEVLEGLEDDGSGYRTEPVDIAALLREVADSAAAAASAREGDERQIHVAGDGAAVAGDGAALRHVFANLLENAVKFSPPGSPVAVRVEPDGDEVCVRVSDAGRGIPPDEVPRVFERFRRGSAPAVGSGLGLFIVKRVVDAHGGRIAVDSQPGRGSTFTVALPAA